MNCLRCAKEMTEKSFKDVVVDVCNQGCGAIWFDQFEIQHFDEKHEVSSDFHSILSELPKDTSVDLETKLNCPRCTNIPMLRRFWSVKRKISVDECPKCAGVWIDSGEITQIHDAFETEEERKAAAASLFNDVFKNSLEKESILRDETLMKTVNVLKYFSPSYYLRDLFPKEQDSSE